MKIEEILQEDLRAWFGKGKKVVLVVAVGTVTTQKATE